MNGIYQEMVSPELYGRELSWGMASALGQDYSTEEAGAVYKEVQKYNFENASVKNVTASIWTKAYNIIANCNKLIEEIEKRVLLLSGGSFRERFDPGRSFGSSSYVTF